MSAANLLLGVAMIFAAPAAATATTAVGEAHMQGEHVVSWGSIEVSAGPALAFAVLTDYDRMADFLPGMLASRVVSRSGNEVIIEQSADQGVFLTDAQAIYDNLGSADKQIELVRGRHYFEDDDAALTDVVDLIAAWTAHRTG